MGVLPLTVLPINSTKSGGSEENIGLHNTAELVTTAIGSVVETLILVAAIAIIVDVIRREKEKRMKSASGVWFLFTILTHYGQCCGPAEIGQTYTITSTANVRSGSRVAWELEETIYYEPVYYITFLYDNDASDPNRDPNFFVGTETQLTIINVTKNDGDGTEMFKHIVNGSVGYNCTLPVYKRASSPTCQPVKLIGNNVITSCTTAEVYPQAKCQFTLQNERTDRRDIIDGTSYITYNHTDPQTEGNEYYSTSCTLQYPVDGLKPGNWTVQVNMYPDQTNVSMAQGTVGQAANTLMLSVPTVYIDSNNCPKGLAGEGDTNVRNVYIREGERASCLCTRAQPGNPPGTIGWSSTQRDNFNILSQSDDEATIEITSPDNFTCQSTSVLNGFNSMSYTPKYAYGPSSASLTFQPPGPIYLCPSQQTNIDITCQVLQNSFNPSALFTIRTNNSNNLVTAVIGDTVQSKSVNYNFTRSGQHTFMCRVENAVYNDIFTEAPESAIQVYVPPANPPSIKVTGQYVMIDDSETWVKQGSNILASCSVGEAYPLVTSVTVTCGQQASASGQLSVSGVSGDELVCRCTVDHETKGRCNGLNLNKDITIQTAYGPTEVTIKFVDDQLREVSDSHLNLCSSEGLDLTVICAVKQSDVRPSMTIDDFKLTKPSGIITQLRYLDRSEQGVYRSINKLKVTSGGRHTLVCEAKNPKLSDIKQTQSVTIEVREPPKDPPVISAIIRKNIDVLLEGDDVKVTCDASGGYPPVQSVTLACDQHNSVTSNRTRAQLTLNQIKQTCNVINCTCQATHVTGCYDMMGVLPLTVLPNNSTKAGVNEENFGPHTTTDLVATAIGSVVGTLLLEAAIALIVFIIRREKAKHKNRNKDKDQNVRDSDPNYLTIHYSDQASVPSSESVKQKTERIYQNQAFGDDTEAPEPDFSAYSYINDE